MLRQCQCCDGFHDNPEDDATDGAHPAWWRGQAYGAEHTARALLKVAAIGRGGGGRFTGVIEEAAQTIEALRDGIERLGAKCIALERRGPLADSTELAKLRALSMAGPLSMEQSAQLFAVIDDMAEDLDGLPEMTARLATLEKSARHPIHHLGPEMRRTCYSETDPPTTDLIMTRSIDRVTCPACLARVKP